MECKICGSVQIKGECQYINGYYYHNYCIEKLAQENNQLKEQRQELRSWLEEWKEMLETDFSRDEFEDGNLVAIEDILSKLNELEGKNE